MKCFLCKGSVADGTTTYMIDNDNSYIIIKNVPCVKCSQCGERYFNGDTLYNIEKIIDKMKHVLTEIALIDYSNAA